MSAQGCCDDMATDCCPETLDRVRDNRNKISSAMAGALFAVGWWFIIDASVAHQIEGKDQLCGVSSTIGLIMFNSISAAMMDNNMYTEGVCGPTGARVWLIIGLMASFGGFIAATWIMAQEYLPHHKEAGGVSLFMQNFLILLSSFIFKFGRTNEMY